MKSLKSLLMTGVFASLALGNFAVASQCTNDVWNKVMKRGKIVIGVKADYKPWGYRSSNGDLIGMEIDMAKDVASALNVSLEMIRVKTKKKSAFYALRREKARKKF